MPRDNPFRKGAEPRPDALSFVDLFSGCGGFSLGFERAGLVCRAAVDNDESAIDTFRRNNPRVTHILRRDLTKFRPKDLDRLLDGGRIDVIIGGPPCQGFSRARQADGANHGGRLIEDHRRYLYRDFLRFVKYYQPKAFVIENVLGIRDAADGEFFTRVQAESRELGYRVIAHAIEAWRFGVPQPRYRQLIIGTRRELPLFIPARHLRPTHAAIGEVGSDALQGAVTLWEAIGDLPSLKSAEGTYRANYDLRRREAQLAKYGGRFIQRVLELDKAKELTSHTARPHSERDLRDFARLREGESSRGAIARGEKMEFPYDRKHFKDRFTRQHRHHLCSTIVAHLKKDGLMYIHPTQPRSLTPREAARVQTFPDWWVFPESPTYAFSQIGNAVPPLAGEAVGRAIVGYLREADSIARGTSTSRGTVPEGPKAAQILLEQLIDATPLNPMQNLPTQELIAAWWAVGYVHPHLHPDAAVENGRELSPGPRRGISPVFEPLYVRSGWPVELLPLAIEARRRFGAGELTEDEYYWSYVAMVGAKAAIRH